MTDSDNQPPSKRAREMLKPFADRVFNDNGDMTVNTAPFDADDLIAAYFAYRATSTLLDEIKARVRGLKRDAWPIVSNGEQPEAVIFNQAIETVLAAIDTIQVEQAHD